MYAITDTSYRAISSPSELGDGERLSSTIPPSLDIAIRSSEARSRRNVLLRACDWTQMTDAPLAAQEREAYVAYRQTLRDIPQLPGFPDVAWPTPPTIRQDAGDELPQQS